MPEMNSLPNRFLSEHRHGFQTLRMRRVQFTLSADPTADPAGGGDSAARGRGGHAHAQGAAATVLRHLCSQVLGEGGGQTWSWFACLLQALFLRTVKCCARFVRVSC